MATQNASSRWVKCISREGTIRGIAIQATELVKETAKMHGLSPRGAVGMGEALIGALLVGAYCKQGERINLNIQGSGLFSQALVDAHPDGTVRGYVIEREKPSLLETEGPWGSGFLSVLRTKGGEGQQPYIGTVELATGFLAKDLTYYWAQSEQIPSSVGLVVNEKNGQIVSAGGFLIQAMPGASPTEVAMIESHIQGIDSFGELVNHHEDPTHVLSEIFQSSGFMLLEEKPIVFSCHCSAERVERALALVGAVELKSILETDGQASVHCDFCAKQYRMDGDALKRLIAQAEGSTVKK